MNGASLPQSPVAAGDLCLLFELGALLCAIPAHRVRRLLLADEAQVAAAEPRGGRTGDWLVVHAEGWRGAGRDLGDLLEAPSAREAWVLVDVPTAGHGVVPIALGTGACLMVERLPAIVPLPRGLFRRRARAFPAAFQVTGIASQRSASAVGLCIDPLALFSSEELSTAAAAGGGAGALESARARP